MIALLVATSVFSLEALAATFGLYRSTDDGRSWTKVGRGLPLDLRIDALGHSGPRHFAGTERGLYVSTDSGDTWTRPTRGVPETVKVFEFARHHGRVYAATTRGLWQSTDHGDTWTSPASAVATPKILSLAATPDGLVAGTDGEGVFVQPTPDAPWEAIGAGLPPRAQIFQFAVHRGAVYAALYARGIYRYDSGARRWRSAGDEQPLRLVAFSGRLFSGRNPGGVFTSTGDALAWTDTSLGLPPHAPTWTLTTTPTTVLIGTAGHSGLMRWEPDAKPAHWSPSDRGLPRNGAAIAFGVGEKLLLAAILAPP